ncbi:MAG: GumC family protein [Gammaproteobacteria bacterium]
MNIPRSNLPMLAPNPVVTLPEVAQEEPQSGMSVLQILSILRAYWKHSAITVVVLVGVMAAVIKFLPKSYVATATLMVNIDNKDPLAGREFPAGLQMTYIPTQIELIRSPVILQPVVERLKLTSDPEFTRGFVGSPQALTESVERNLNEMLQVQPGMGSQLLYVAVESKSASKAATLTNAIADEYLRQERQRTNEPAGERADRYAKQLAELRAKAVAAQDKVTEFRRANGILGGEESGGSSSGSGGKESTASQDVEMTALTELEAKLLETRNQRRELETRQIAPQADSQEMLGSPAIQELRRKLKEQESKMAQLRSTLGARHPDVLELDSEMSSTRRSLASEMQAISTGSGAELARVRDLESRYVKAVEAQRARVSERRGVQDQAMKLMVELQSAQETYKHALDGYDQIMFASTGNYANVSMINRADPPVKSVKPNKIKYFLASCIFAFGVGLGWPFAYELFVNRKLRCRDDFERVFHVPVLMQFGPIPATARAR